MALRKTCEVSSDCHVIKGIILCKCASQGIFFRAADPMSRRGVFKKIKLSR
jgi:hypothetical protein